MRFPVVICVFLAAFVVATAIPALPVPLGEIDLELESFDGRQTGRAFLSTDEAGAGVELLLGYKGFGLDSVKWNIDQAGLETLRAALESAAFWRSQLLEHTVTQTVVKPISPLSSNLLYTYREKTYPFDGVSYVIEFVREGSDYALILRETSPGTESRRLGEKSLPAFTLRVTGAELPALRDMVGTENVTAVLEDYAAEKALIEGIFSQTP